MHDLCIGHHVRWLIVTRDRFKASMDSSEITLEAVSSVSQIPAGDWDACANPAPCPVGLEDLDTLAPLDATGSGAGSKAAYNPFISHSFFSALETSNSAVARTGWGPRHLVARLGGEIAGIVPCYLKSHSQGEYVFDRGWADAYERAGGRYYPKLQVSVPFTPAAGPRLLIRAGVDKEQIGTALASGLVALCDATKASSVHVTFAREAEWKFLAAHGFLQRTDQQFHWHNQGYRSFDDFLATLNSRHRKAIKRERRDALAEGGITIHALTGADITEDAWDAFFAFYMETGSRKWGRPYLTRTFFSLVGESMAEDVLLVMARRNGRWIAGAINFIGSDTLFGRNWGAIEHHPFLHFEVCYYQAIEFAILRGLKVVEAGAQGEHKLARGYLPHTTYSAHYIVDPDFRHAISDYLRRERAYVAEAGRELAGLGPFRKVADEAP